MLKKGNFFPFSPTFLSQYVGVDLDSDDNEGQNNNVDANEDMLEDIRMHEQTDDARPFLACAVVQDELYVVGIRENEACHLTGFCTVTTLTDNLLFDGYLAVLNEIVPIGRPVWTPALKIWVNPGGNRTGTIVIPEEQRHRKKIRTAIKGLQELSEDNPLVSFFIVEKMQWDRQDLFIQMEDTSVCQITNQQNSSEYPQYHQPLLCAVPTQAISVGTALLASERYMTLHRFDVSRFPKPWVTTVSDVLKPPRRCLRIMLCGAKGTGKSTCLKYITNQCMFLLRKHPKRSIYILDLDLGQPELYTPGSLSLHKLTQPLLSSASHLHLQQPVASVFLGDITSKNEPGLYLAAVKRLFDQFLHLCQQNHHHHQHHSHHNDTSNVATKNSTTKMDKDNNKVKNKDSNSNLNEKSASTSSRAHETDVSNNHCSNNHTKKHYLSYHNMDDLPHHPILLINTDGFVRHLGADILAGVIETTRPTHILHLQPRPYITPNNTNNNININNNAMKAGQRQQQERHQAALQVSQSLHDMLTQLTDQLHDHNSSAGNGTNDNDNKNKNISVKTELFAVQSAIYQPLRHISAPELRHLRLVAYFLRHVAESPRAFQTLQNLLLCRDTPHSLENESFNRLFLEVSQQQCETKSLISIKNAVLQDPRQSHWLSLMLLTHAPCIIIPLQHVLLQSATQETQPLRPEHWLACVNARLVGVSVFWETNGINNDANNTNSSNNTYNYNHNTNDRVYYEPLRLKLPRNPPHNSNSMSITVGGVLSPLTQNTAIRCDSLGLGIVRCVDVTHRNPSTDNDNNHDHSNDDSGALYLICPALIHYFSHMNNKNNINNNNINNNINNVGASDSSTGPQPPLDVSRCKIILTLASPTLQLPPYLTAISNAATSNYNNNSDNSDNNVSVSCRSVSVAGWPGYGYVFSSETMVGEGRNMNKPRPNLKRRQPSNISNNSNMKKKK